MTKAQKELEEKDIERTRELLRELIKAGDRVYTILNHVSSSGMSRRITVVIPTNNSAGLGIRNISWYVAKVLGYKLYKNSHEIVVGGCGMDMGYHIVYSLSRALFREDFACIGAGCPSNDHVNGREIKEGEQHSDAGYALNHSWL